MGAVEWSVASPSALTIHSCDARGRLPKASQVFVNRGVGACKARNRRMLQSPEFVTPAASSYSPPPGSWSCFG